MARPDEHVARPQLGARLDDAVARRDGMDELEVPGQRRGRRAGGHDRVGAARQRRTRRDLLRHPGAHLAGGELQERRQERARLRRVDRAQRVPVDRDERVARHVARHLDVARGDQADRRHRRREPLEQRRERPQRGPERHVRGRRISHESQIPTANSGMPIAIRATPSAVTASAR